MPFCTAADDGSRLVLAGQHVGIGHARHRYVAVALAPAVAGRRMFMSRAFCRSCM